MSAHLSAGRLAALLVVAFAPGCMWAAGGDLQAARAGSSPGAPLRAQLLTDDGKPVANVRVDFQAPPGGAVSPPFAITDGSGFAATTVRLGPGTGMQTTVAVARLDGVTIKNNPTTFRTWAMDASSEQLLQLHNGARAQAGLPPLAGQANLCALAQRWSTTMASQGRIFHQSDLGGAFTFVNGDGWASVGENVGVGGDIPGLHAAFMNSPGHRANILGNYDKVGVATTVSAGRLYVAIELWRSR